MRRHTPVAMRPYLHVRDVHLFARHAPRQVPAHKHVVVVDDAHNDAGGGHATRAAGAQELPALLHVRVDIGGSSGIAGTAVRLGVVANEVNL